MLRFLGWLLAIAVLLALVVLAGSWWLLKDPNLLRPQLLELLEVQTGVPVRIEGALGWRLLPPLTLYAEELSAEHEGVRYELARLDLDVDLSSVVFNRDLEQWRIRSLKLDDLNVIQAADRIRVHELTLSDFAFNRPSRFATRLTRYAEGEEPMAVAAHGQLLYQPEAGVLELADTRVETDDLNGLCNIDAVIGDPASYVDPPDSVIPVSVWRRFDWNGSCLLDDFRLRGQHFENVRLDLSNDEGNSITTATFPRFFGGHASLEMDINAQRDPVAWRITPDLADVESQALMRWLDQNFTWAAPLAYGGTVTMTGNTRAALANSVRGVTHIDGGQGRIDITWLRTPLLNLATLIKEDAAVRAWPEIWQYEQLSGNWQIEGTQHTVDLALDNLSALMNGTYDPLSDALDMAVQLKLEPPLPDGHGFRLSPLLEDIPIPVRCQGSLEAPKCTLDQASAQRIVSEALSGAGGSDLRSKLEQKIDKDVPEEYRETARGLLDAFTRALDGQQQER